MGKLVKLKDLKRIRKRFKKPVVLTGGTFDLLHLGHAEFLKYCKKFGKTLIVQIASDAYVKEKKGKERPIIPQFQRAKLVSYLEFVDFVFISKNRCESKIIYDLVLPDVLILSNEEKEEKLKYLSLSLGEKRLKKLKVVFYHFKIIFYSPGLGISKKEGKFLSTTQIIKTIKEKTAY